MLTAAAKELIQDVWLDDFKRLLIETELFLKRRNKFFWCAVIVHNYQFIGKMIRISGKMETRPQEILYNGVALSHKSPDINVSIVGIPQLRLVNRRVIAESFYNKIDSLIDRAEAQSTYRD